MKMKKQYYKKHALHLLKRHDDVDEKNMYYKNIALDDVDEKHVLKNTLDDDEKNMY